MCVCVSRDQFAGILINLNEITPEIKDLKMCKGWMECSALTEENVPLLFEKLIPSSAFVEQNIKIENNCSVM